MTLPNPDPTLPRPIPEDVISDLFEVLSRVQVKWWNRPQKMLGLPPNGKEQAWIKLSLLSTRGLGIDEYRSQFNQVTGQFDSEVSGQRLFTVSCRCESLDAQARPFDILERIRMGIRTLSATNTLQAQGLAMARIHPIVSPGQVMNSDGRVVRVDVMDIEFAMAQNVIPQNDDRGAIATVNGGTQAPGTTPTIPGTVH